MFKEPIDYSHEQEQALRDALGDELYEALGKALKKLKCPNCVTGHLDILIMICGTCGYEAKRRDDDL